MVLRSAGQEGGIVACLPLAVKITSTRRARVAPTAAGTCDAGAELICLALRRCGCLALPLLRWGLLAGELLELDRAGPRVAQTVRLRCEAGEFGREHGLSGWGG